MKNLTLDDAHNCHMKLLKFISTLPWNHIRYAELAHFLDQAQEHDVFAQYVSCYIMHQVYNP
jgi:hypothetical protein